MKDARARLLLAKRETGGSEDRPIEVTSASVIEPQARSMPCVVCGSEVRVGEHTAENIKGHRVRRVNVKCVQCGVTRDVFFQVSHTLN